MAYIEGTSMVFLKDKPWTKENPISDVEVDLFQYPEEFGDFESVRCVLNCNKLGAIVKESGKAAALKDFLDNLSECISEKKIRVLFKRNSRSPRAQMSGKVYVKALKNVLSSSPPPGNFPLSINYPRRPYEIFHG